MQSELFEHFATDNQNCFLTDCSIRLTDKTDGSDPTRREEYWRKVLKTVAYVDGYFCSLFIHLSLATVSVM